MPSVQDTSSEAEIPKEDGKQRQAGPLASHVIRMVPRAVLSLPPCASCWPSLPHWGSGSAVHRLHTAWPAHSRAFLALHWEGKVRFSWLVVSEKDLPQQRCCTPGDMFSLFLISCSPSRCSEEHQLLSAVRSCLDQNTPLFKENFSSQAQLPLPEV